MSKRKNKTVRESIREVAGMADDAVEIIQAKHNEIWRIVSALPAPVAGHILGMLTGTWLAGHQVSGPDKKVALEKQQSIRSHLMMLQTKTAFTYAGLRDEMRQKQESEAGCGTATGGEDISGTDRGVGERHGASAGDRGGGDTSS